MAQSDQQIIEQILLGETQLYAVLVSKYQKKLFNFMLRLCLVKQDAEDLTQEAFIKAYEKIETFQHERSFLNWLYAIALNLYKDSKRKNMSQAAKRELYFYEQTNDSGDTIVDSVVRQDRLTTLFKALAELPEEYREVLVLRYGNELTMREISQILMVSVSGAKMRVSRGLGKLKTVFFRE